MLSRLETVFGDVRYAFRLLRRNPLFALTAIVSLAIGIGANTTVFTIANALLLRPPTGVVDPGRIVDIGRSQPGRRGAPTFNTVSYPNYLDIRSRATTLEGVYAYQPVAEPMSLGGTDSSERIFGCFATVNYFTVLGAQPALGRLFLPSDRDDPGASPIVVLSHDFWVRRFNRDSDIVGRTLRINGHSFTVAGVAAEGFQGTGVLTTDLWMPAGMAASLKDVRTLTNRDGGWLWLGGRLKQGVSVAQSASELSSIASALEREYPDQNRGKGLHISTSSPIPGNLLPVAGFLAVLTAIVALVLFIACSNVAGVLLARAVARRREIAVRVAIGAGQARVIRQLLTETTVLFLLSGIGGLLLARVMTTLLVRLVPALPFPVGVSLALDVRVAAFTVGLSFIAATLTGLVPALQTAKRDVVPALQNESRSGWGRQRWRNGFVVAQVAFSIMLVIAAGLLVQVLQRASAVDPGFDTRGVELASLDMSLGGYTAETGPVFAAELVDKVRALPGVESAALAERLPLTGSRGVFGLTVPGVSPPDGGAYFRGSGNVVSPGYFATMRIPLAAGRDFTEADRRGAPPVAIIGEGAARQLWPGEDALGKTLGFEAGPWRRAEDARTLTIVGVARDVKYLTLRDTSSPLFIYTPLQQEFADSVTIVARSTQGQRLTSDIRSLLTSLNPNLPIVGTQTLEELTALSLVPQRVAASVSGSLGIVGLLLAALGIYGVTAHAVARRTREIGLRIALGAERSDVVKMVLMQGMRLVILGGVIGLTLAAASSRLLVSVLYGVPPLDPLTFGGATVVFALIGLTACYIPSRRATRVDPVVALRDE
jgi:predicted permease